VDNGRGISGSLAVYIYTVVLFRHLSNTEYCIEDQIQAPFPSQQIFLLPITVLSATVVYISFVFTVTNVTMMIFLKFNKTG